MVGTEREKAGFHSVAQSPRARPLRSGLNGGKLGLSSPAAQPPKQPQPLYCPECGSERLYRDGIRNLTDGSSVQRWLCRNCGYRFTDPKHKTAQKQWKNPPFCLNRPSNPSYYCQGNDDPEGREPSAPKAVQTLATVEKESEKRAAGAAEELSDAEVKGRIVEFAWWLKSEGRSELTITNSISKLRKLAEFSSLLDPEKVKETLSNLKWKNSTKMIAASVYTKFLEFLGLSWKPPKYQIEETFPFIPLENEIDQLIASCGKRTATLLQLLKETGIRIGEAAKLRWIDFDAERRIVSVRPLKGSNPRIFKISDKLARMLNALAKHGELIFNGNPGVLRRAFEIQRARAAEKLKNPRLKNITFHTLRHWKATMEYHKTKDPWHVKNVLGHKNLKSTQVYINIEHALFQTESDEFHVKIAETPGEIKALLEVGFEYVCEKDGLMFFRKRK
jgi:integrase/rubredoxin